MSSTERVVRACLILSATAVLAACASTREQPTAQATHAAPAPAAKVADAKDPYAYRFNMTQNGKAMSADDFEAWMKARGLRVSKGPEPAQKDPKLVAQGAAKARPKSQDKGSD
ncbi:hypothetical protein [Pseudoxanthomonas suwonensis]|uniref:hypothetical protein n=1 Tax=Pseudoxanthomonas suwonensis TaxID=314722 RepID=UPI000467DFD9|nr:hypothetical protein [Pseudoxanthomonas suwonensis]